MDWATSGSRKEISNHHRARRFLALSCFLCGALLLTLAGCDTESVLIPDDSSELDTAMRILGSDSAVLAYGDVQHHFGVMAGLLEEFDEQTEAMDEVMSEVFERTGIQLDEDIHGVYVGLNYLNDDTEGALVVFVDFDQESVVERITQESDVTRIESSWPVDAFSPDNEHAPAIAFVEGSLIILGSDADVLTTLLARTYEESTSSLPSGAMFDKISSHYNWAMIRDLDQALQGERDFELDGVAAMILPAVRSVRDVGIGVSSDGESVEAQLFLDPTDQMASDDLESLLSGVKGMARLQFNGNDEVKSLIEKIEIDQDDGLVEVSFEADRDDLEALEYALKPQFDRKGRN